MSYSIITTANARLDVQEAISWENRRSEGLAVRFLENLEKKLLIVARSPYIYAIRYENVRCALTDVFPYLIHFTIDDSHQQVIILRILHTSRKPIW